MGRKPTVAGGVDAFQKGTFGLEAGDAVSLTVEHLQLGEDAGVQLRQPVIPYVQLGHMSEQVGLIGDHTGDLIQPDGGKQRLSCTGGDLCSISRSMPEDINIFHSLHTFLFNTTDGDNFFLSVHTQIKHVPFIQTSDHIWLLVFILKIILSPVIQILIPVELKTDDSEN